MTQAMSSDWMAVAVSAAVVLALPAGAAPASAQGVDTVMLGAPDAPATARDGFTRVTSVRELNDGRLLLTDPGESAVYLVDWDRDVVNTIGGTGEGPGEYTAPGRLYPLAGDSTLLTDIGNHRWFLMEDDAIVETFMPTRSINRRLLAVLSGADQEGNVLGAEGFKWETVEDAHGSRAEADSLDLWLASRALTDEPEYSRIAQLGGIGRFGREVVRFQGMVLVNFNPMGVEDQAHLFRDGWIAVAWNDPYRVDWRRPDGEWHRGAPLPFVEEPVTASQECFHLELRWPDRDCPVDWVPDFPSTLPAQTRWQRVLGTADGLLVVPRMPSVRHEESRFYDLIDRESRLVRTVRVAANERIVGFGPSSVYVVTTDEVDLQHLTRHPWPPP